MSYANWSICMRYFKYSILCSIATDPVDEKYIWPNRSVITNQQIDDYNRVALEHM